jgi:hypothetical protein
LVEPSGNEVCSRRQGDKLQRCHLTLGLFVFTVQSKTSKKSTLKQHTSAEKPAPEESLKTVITSARQQHMSVLDDTSNELWEEACKG